MYIEGRIILLQDKDVSSFLRRIVMKNLLKLLNRNNHLQLITYIEFMKKNASLAEKYPFLTIPLIIWVPIIGILLLSYEEISYNIAKVFSK